MHVQHVFFLGNRKKGVRWLSWAKTKLKDLQRYHPGFDGASFGVKRYSLEAGEDGFIEVLIKMVKEQEWIIIWAEETPSIYMESGILDHRNIAPLNEDTYLPSILHYGDDIKAIRGEFAELGKLRVKEAATNKLDGENLGEGDSNSVGCPKEEKLISITASSDFGARTFEAQKPIYCAPSRIYSVKNVQSRMPPSMFSGKLRLFVQALYGSKRDDYALDPLLVELGPLKIDNADLNWTYNNNSALFSGRDYEYFLLLVSSSGLWGRAMETTDAGKALRKYLNDNPGIPTERKKRYETYLLSTLYVSSESSWVKITEDVGDAYVKGTPWYYGWSWNMGGTEARAVTIQLKPGTDNEWQSTMFRLSVSERDLAETLEEGRLTASFVTVEDTQDFTLRINEDLIWYPNDIGPGMRIFLSQPSALNAPTQIESNVPMYCVSNYVEDGFDVVRFKRELFGSGVGGLGGEHGSQNEDADPLCGVYDCGYYSEVDTAYEIGFFVENKENDFAAYSVSGENVLIQGNEARVGDVQGEESTGSVSIVSAENQVNQCQSFNATGLSHGRYKEFSSSGGDITLQGDLDADSMLVVPISDCDSVYLARLDRFTANTNVVSSHTFGNTVVRAAIDIYKNSTEIAEGGENLRISVGWTDGGDGSPGLASRDEIKNAAFADGLLNEVDAMGDWAHVDIQYFFNGEFTEVHTQNHVSNEDLAGGLFFPPCVTNETGIGFNTVPDDWSADAFSTAGYEFDPVLFPEPETMPPVISLSTANFGDYKARKNIDIKDLITKGGYGFDDNNISERTSWVGFA